MRNDAKKTNFACNGIPPGMHHAYIRMRLFPAAIILPKRPLTMDRFLPHPLHNLHATTAGSRCPCRRMEYAAGMPRREKHVHYSPLHRQTGPPPAKNRSAGKQASYSSGEGPRRRAHRRHQSAGRGGNPHRLHRGDKHGCHHRRPLFDRLVHAGARFAGREPSWMALLSDKIPRRDKLLSLRER